MLPETKMALNNSKRIENLPTKKKSVMSSNSKQKLNNEENGSCVYLTQPSLQQKRRQSSENFDSIDENLDEAGEDNTRTRKLSITNESRGRRPSLTQAALSHQRRRSSLYGSIEENLEEVSKGNTRSRRLSFTNVAFGMHRGRRASMIWRRSISSEKNEHKPKMENTYKMSPDVESRFRGTDVEEVIAQVLERQLKDRKTYCSVLAGTLSCQISQEIKDEVKNLGLSRYRLISHVMLGQKGSQDLVSSSRCLWDSETDNYASVTYTSGPYNAVATLYAVYLE